MTSPAPAPATSRGAPQILIPGHILLNFSYQFSVSLNFKLFQISNLIKMGLFKNKDKTRPDLNPPQGTQNQGLPQPPHQQSHSFNDSTYYSSSNASTADSRMNVNQNQPPPQNQNQPRGTTVTTTTTTTTSKSLDKPTQHLHEKGQY
jgi:hypothetical protein